ncbi:MAG: 50S ribosomal protein L29 [Coleofasciculus sp. C1-SOL-03]|jgi:large subunit ribosomal protein L29
MPLSKIDDARTLSDQELADEILAAKRELFELRLQQATRRLEKPHQFKHLKHRIAQMMTIARERQLAAASEQTPPSVSDSAPTATTATTQPPQAEAEEAVKADEQGSVGEQATEATPESSPSEANEEE